MILVFATGCGAKKDLQTAAEVTGDTEEDTSQMETTQDDAKEETEETEEKAEKKDKEAQQTEDNAQKDTNTSKENTSSSTTAKQDAASNAGSTPTEAAQSTAAPATAEVSTPVSYSPENVVRLAKAKVKAGGMLLLSEELDRKLAEGIITQEEYNEYYPYDGTGYYSVFVETDLSKASTVSGSSLGSEEAIAQYIADMLLLETDPLVDIEYAGVYTSSSGNTFYEFRCHR
jgi:hypothetical protein